MKPTPHQLECFSYILQHFQQDIVDDNGEIDIHFGRRHKIETMQWRQGICETLWDILEERDIDEGMSGDLIYDECRLALLDYTRQH